MANRLFIFMCCVAICPYAVAITNFYMDDNCGNVIDVGKYDQVRVQLSPNVAYRTLQCTLFLDTDPGSQLMVYFRSMTIPSDASCHNQYLEIHDGNTPSASYIVGLRGKLCGKPAPSGVYKTTGRYMTLYFGNDDPYYGTYFDVIVTSYHRGVCDSFFEYGCDNGRCIDDSLTCNGYNPCGDHSDCYNTVTIAVGGIAGLVIGGIVFVVIVVVAVIICRRRRYRYSNI